MNRIVEKLKVFQFLRNSELEEKTVNSNSQKAKLWTNTILYTYQTNIHILVLLSSLLGRYVIFVATIKTVEIQILNEKTKYY